MSIAYKEGIKIPPPALNEIILASNQDVRQVMTAWQKSICALIMYSLTPSVSHLTVPFYSPGDPQPEHVVRQRQGDDV